MITKRSRYNKTAIVELPRREGEAVRLVSLRKISTTPAVFTHTPREGDRLDLLAHRHYRDATQFHRIADASDYLDPFEVIEFGIPLPIPPKR